MADVYHRLEVKVIGADGKPTTQVIKIDYKDNISGKPLVFKTRESFPATGDTEFLYIATNEEAVYRYDSSENQYKSLSSHWSAINIIDGGNATSF